MLCYVHMLYDICYITYVMLSKVCYINIRHVIQHMLNVMLYNMLCYTT